MLIEIGHFQIFVKSYGWPLARPCPSVLWLLIGWRARCSVPLGALLGSSKLLVGSATAIASAGFQRKTASRGLARGPGAKPPPLDGILRRALPSRFTKDREDPKWEQRSAFWPCGTGHVPGSRQGSISFRRTCPFRLMFYEYGRALGRRLRVTRASDWLCLLL